MSRKDGQEECDSNAINNSNKENTRVKSNNSINDKHTKKPLASNRTGMALTKLVITMVSSCLQKHALYGHTDNDVLQEEQLYDSNVKISMLGCELSQVKIPLFFYSLLRRK